MDKRETIMILAVLKAAYPNGYRNMSDEDTMTLVNLWARVFTDWPYESVNNAVDAVIVMNKTNFPPSPGLVMDQLIKISSPPEMTEMEAWGYVYKAIKNSAWHAQEEFKKLPAGIRHSVGSPEMLKSWSEMPVDTIQSVVQSNFMRAFRAKKVQEFEQKALPGEAKDKILELSEGMGL